MAPRERKLLILLGTAAFVMLNLVGYTKFSQIREKSRTALSEAENKHKMALTIAESREQATEEIDWLAEHDPEPAAAQDVLTGLQEFCEAQAKSAGLELKSQRPLESEETEGLLYHRARIELRVSGQEQSLYRWFDRINDPSQLRVAVEITLAPNSKDDTKIDCTAIVGQWFLP